MSLDSELTGRFVPCIGLRRIEAKAQKSLLYCQALLEWPEIPIPVPVESCIESALKIRLGITDLTRLGPGILGAAYIASNEILISEEALKPEGRFRFTCAHELGHFVLHRHLRAAFTDGETPDLRVQARVEREANCFAAAFLMPSGFIEQAMLRTCMRLRLDVQYCMNELLVPTRSSIWLWERIFLPELKTQFGVSSAALLVRCSNLQLASRANQPLLPSYVREELLLPATRLEQCRFRLNNGRPEAAT